MGIGGISVGSLLLILVIVLLVFGTKKLRNVGGDLGGAIKGFRSAMKDGDSRDEDDDKEPAQLQSRSQEGEQTPRSTDSSESRDRSSS